jgi:hypothetical protein
MSVAAATGKAAVVADILVLAVDNSSDVMAVGDAEVGSGDGCDLSVVSKDGYCEEATADQKRSMEEALPSILEGVPSTMREKVRQALRRFAHVFSDEEGSCIKVPPVSIPLKSVQEQLASPGRRKTFCNGYSCTPVERKWLDTKFKEYQQQGLMRAHTGTSLTASPAFAVGSPGLSDHRTRCVVDFSFINWLLQDVRFPAPTFEDLLRCIEGSRWFSLLDLKGGYHQVPIDEEARRLLTISWNGQLFRPLVLWEGVGSAPAIFQSLMSRLFDAVVRLSALLIYLDDHLVHSRTPQEHLRHLCLYLRQCELFRVKLKLSKCQFFCQQLRWLGRVVGHGKVQADPSYIAKLQDYQRPRMKDELWRFLGCVGWVVRFLPQAQLTLAPLYDLLTNSTKKQPLVWGDTTVKAWEGVQQLLRHPQALRIPVTDQRYGIIVDASCEGWGALLVQERVEGRGDWQVVNMTARRWKTLREQQEKRARPLELRGLAAALKEWASFVRNGRPVVVLSDHRPLEGRLRPQPHDSESLREVLGTILQYPVEVSYLPGDQMPADWPSREGLQFAE